MLIRNLTIAALCVYTATLVLFLTAGILFFNGLTALTRSAATAHSIGVHARSISQSLEDVSRARAAPTKPLRERLKLELAGTAAQVGELSRELGGAYAPKDLKEAALRTAASWKRFDTAAGTLLGAKTDLSGAATGAVLELAAFDSSLESLTVILNGAFSHTSAYYRKGFIAFAAYFIVAWSLISAFIILRVALPLSDVAKKLRVALASGAEPAFGAVYMGELSSITGYIDAVSRSLKETSTSWRIFEETLVCPVIELDTSGKVVFMNSAAARITGHRTADITGKDFSELVPTRSHRAFTDFFDTVIKGETVIACESQLIFNDNEVKHVVYNAAPIRSGGHTIGCLISFGDGTWDKITGGEQEMRHLETRELKEKLDKITRELEEFAVMAVRREYKMQEIRERLRFLKDSLDTEKRTAPRPLSHKEKYDGFR